MTERKLENVLDYGFVELVDHMGSDLTVVNAARVSFGKRKDVMDASDEKLINYLVKHSHFSPLRHVYFQFHCKMPEHIARQVWKHIVGIAYTEGGASCNDQGWNEISGRYIDLSGFEFYTPNGFRTQSASNKQASTDEVVRNSDELEELYKTHNRASFDLYSKLIEKGVAKEQARGVLPFSLYTEFYWTISLQALANFIKLRRHEGSQYEIRLYAEALEKLALQIVPVSLQSLLENT
jgi:thymidylate synthase (FAD)